MHLVLQILLIVISKQVLIEHIFAQRNAIYYTTNNDAIIMPTNIKAFNASIINNQYIDGVGCITFDKEINQIGERAFNNCWRLTSITLPETIDSIGDNAFQNCIRLSKIIVSDRLSVIGKYAFQNCKKIAINLSLQSQLKEIGDYAFAGCDSLRFDISKLSDSTYIGKYAFIDCAQLIINNDSINNNHQANHFRFLTWNIEGLIWRTNYQLSEIDSIIDNKGINKMIEKYNPRIYTLNEVPYYLSKDISPKSSGIKLICGENEDKVHTAHCTRNITNTIVTKDTFFECKDFVHKYNFKTEKRHFGIATQYIDGKKIAIVVVHLVAPFNPKQKTDSIRVLQVKDIIEETKNYEYVIIAGDFNCNVPNNGEDLNGSATLLRKAGFEEVIIKKWYVDHIFVKGFNAFDRGADNLDYTLSDHPLLWVDLSIKQ